MAGLRGRDKRRDGTNLNPQGVGTRPCKVSPEILSGDENFPLVSCEGKCAKCEAGLLTVSDSGRSVPEVDDGTVDLAQGGCTSGEAGRLAVVRGGIHW